MLYTLTRKNDRATGGVDLSEAEDISFVTSTENPTPDWRLAERCADTLEDDDYQSSYGSSIEWVVDFFDDKGGWLAAFEIEAEFRRELVSAETDEPPIIENVEIYSDETDEDDEEAAEPDLLTLPLPLD